MLLLDLFPDRRMFLLVCLCLVLIVTAVVRGGRALHRRLGRRPGLAVQRRRGSWHWRTAA